MSHAAMRSESCRVPSGLCSAGSILGLASSVTVQADDCESDTCEIRMFQVGNARRDCLLNRTERRRGSLVCRSRQGPVSHIPSRLVADEALKSESLCGDKSPSPGHWSSGGITFCAQPSNTSDPNGSEIHALVLSREAIHGHPGICSRSRSPEWWQRLLRFEYPAHFEDGTSLSRLQSAVALECFWSDAPKCHAWLVHGAEGSMNWESDGIARPARACPGPWTS